MTIVKIYFDNPEERIPLAELGIHPDMLRILEDFGVIETDGDSIDLVNRKRLFRSWRLRSLLGVNLAGTAIILDLLDRIDYLERELYRLKAKR